MKIHDTTTRKWVNDDIPFIVKEIAIKEKTPRPIDADGGAICLCLQGNASIAIDTRTFTISKGGEAVLLPDSSLFIKDRSGDFRMFIFVFSKSMHQQAVHKFPPSFFSRLYSHPVYQHPEGCEKMTLSYMSILDGLQNDRNNRFGVIIATNLLRSMMLNIYDKFIRHSYSQETITRSRKEEIFNRFIQLINERGQKHREVSYYADKLCISTRYLTEITRSMNNESPKDTIDFHIVQEIKLMLTFSDMTIQQIADYLHFPDQSYLGRYFKRHTGMSPVAYRKKEMVL